MRAPRMQPRDRADAAPVARTSLARADLVALAVVVVGGLLVRLALALWMPGPIVHADETGSFALARHLVGDGPDPLLYFYPGYAVALAPPFLVTDDLATAYRLALLINCALGALSMLLAARLGRVLSPHRLAPAAAATVVALYPPLVLNTALTWSENLLPPLVLALALTAAAAARAPALAWRWAAAGLLVGALYATHPRLLPAAIALLLVAVASARPLREHVRSLAACAGSVAVAIAAAQALAAALSSPDAAYSDEAVSPLRALEHPGATLATLAGVLLYALAATFGLAGLGAAVALRGLPLGRRRAERPAAPAAASLLLVLLAAGLVVVSVLALADPEPTRGDYLVYGRYAEPGIVGLLVLGAVALVGLPTRRAVALLAAALAAVPCAALVLVLRSDALRALPTNPANIWGILGGTVSWEAQLPLGLTGGGVRPLAIAAYGALGAALVVAALLAARRGAVALVVLGALLAGGTWVGFDRAVEPMATTREAERVVPPVLRRLQAIAPDVRCVAIDRESLSPWHRWDIVYGTTLGIELPKGLAAASTRCDGLVLTAAPDVEARHPGAIALVAEVATPQTLWVLPGALADRVRADGTLVATGQRALPEGARSARLAVRSAPARLASGARAALELEVAHPGGPPAWQADALHPVEVTASWVPRGRFGPVLGVARAVLGRDVAPGASLPLALDVRAADRDGGGLPAGSYDLLLRVEERGIGAFPTAAAPPVRVPVAVG